MPDVNEFPIENKDQEGGFIGDFLDRWYEPGPQSAAIALGEGFTLGLEVSNVYPWIWRTFPKFSAETAYLFMHFNDLLHLNPEYLHRLKEAILSPGGAAFLVATGVGVAVFADLNNRTGKVIYRSVLNLLKHGEDGDE